MGMRKANTVITKEGEWAGKTWLSRSREEAPTGTEVKQKDIVEENSDEPKTLVQANSHINNNAETHSSCAFLGEKENLNYILQSKFKSGMRQQ